jgi:polyhydroxyalkanoate synthesis regulator phasin
LEGYACPSLPAEIAWHPQSIAAGRQKDSDQLEMNMGALWEIVQTGLMYGQKRNADSLEDRIQALENQLQSTQNTLRALVREIEKMQGEDIDRDGRIG